MKIPNNLKSEFDNDFESYMNGNKEDKSLTLPFYKSAWLASKTNDFIWKFFENNKLGKPDWSGEQSHLQVICDLGGIPKIIIESYLPLSDDIWQKLSMIALEQTKQDGTEYREENHLYSVFVEVLLDAPFNIYHENNYFCILAYDGN